MSWAMGRLCGEWGGSYARRLRRSIVTAPHTLPAARRRSTAAHYIAWKRARAPVAVRLAGSGVRPSSRFPAIKESELGLGEWTSCLSAPVQTFNYLFSAGYAAGLVIVAVVTFIASPFLGAFVALSHYAIHLVRMFSRSEGRLLTDILGLSDLMDQHTAAMLEEMGVVALDGTPDTMPLITTSAGAPGGGGNGGGGGAASPFIVPTAYGAAPTAGAAPMAVYVPPAAHPAAAAAYVAMPQHVAVAMHAGGGGEDPSGAGAPASYGGLGGYGSTMYPGMAAASAPPPKA